MYVNYLLNITPAKVHITNLRKNNEKIRTITILIDSVAFYFTLTLINQNPHNYKPKRLFFLI